MAEVVEVVEEAVTLRPLNQQNVVEKLRLPNGFDTRGTTSVCRGRPVQRPSLADHAAKREAATTQEAVRGSSRSRSNINGSLSPPTFQRPKTIALTFEREVLSATPELIAGNSPRRQGLVIAARRANAHRRHPPWAGIIRSD